MLYAQQMAQVFPNTIKIYLLDVNGITSRNTLGQVLPFKFSSLPEFMPKFFGTSRDRLTGLVLLTPVADLRQKGLCGEDLQRWSIPFIIEKISLLSAPIQNIWIQLHYF
jgi:hypothetical protein